MKRLVVAIALLVGIFVAAACGGSSGSTAGSGGSSHYSSTALGSSSGTPVKGVPDQSAGGAITNPNPTSDVVPPIQGPQVIRQAQLAISVKSGSFDSSLATVRSVVEIEHGYVSGTDAQASPVTNDQIRTGVISFMVPAANFDAAIDALSNLGKVTNYHISGQDVSAQYVDLQARLANEEAQRNAMLALLAKAQTVEQIIMVQNQIGQITGQIEQLKGQIQYIDQRRLQHHQRHADRGRRAAGDGSVRQLGLRNGPNRRRAQLRDHGQLPHHFRGRGRPRAGPSRSWLPGVASGRPARLASGVGNRVGSPHTGEPTSVSGAKGRGRSSNLLG